MTYYARINGSLGPMLLLTDGERLTGLHFFGEKYQPEIAEDWIERPRHPLLKRAAREIAEYFTGRRRRFTVPLAGAGTPFQRRVWRALGKIPYGRTVSYGEVAHSIGARAAVRAVGAAIGRNPLAIIVPCHRVIGADGSLTGYAGGLDRKRALLTLEGVTSQRRSQPASISQTRP